MTDLGAFNVSTFAGGHNNLNIVKGIPAHASATSVAAASTSTNRPLSWDNSSSVLQLLYPAHSINPAKKPQGGAQFYASPLDIAEAKNITLQYSVFFPVDFDWVLAGKLPGIYGGRTGCSGGDSALDCFSTRLMWRRGGSGELYMYVPKDKQSRALCFHPQSVCDTAYGFSIGRGSFKWARGTWTTVQQSIALNTPGKRDGSFALDVNGKRVIERHDIYYRGVPQRFSRYRRDRSMSTFFGGHDPKYATPRDQYVWFKDFAISHNG
ncbi:hypothetical protein BDZ94DRAFT_1281921 [Collybia nuda]|uniref:Polysaccharide lyase 14 domain-containing protein n=1 Tax=Collybia nuda TaxID=64659 RepID=A0A9P6CL48_9AGAR|nr:hypothetical protein BDZ94DRAFT_1281921 [Collybia nuda]